MIYAAPDLPLPGKLRADVCVVGCGAGGATVAAVAAEAGARVVVLEPGGLVTPGDMNQREPEMFKKLLWAGGSRTTTDRAVRVHQGKGVGGSTLHNLNLCKRIPAEIRAEWRRQRGMEALDDATWEGLYDEVEAMLEVVAVPRERWNRHNRLLEAGCKALGWRGGGLRHNRKGCTGSGYCEVGCVYDAKNNALKVFVPRAVRAGAEIVTHCQVVRVLHDGGRVTGVLAVALDPVTREPLGEVQVEAKRVCCSASATGTPAILRRSGLPDPGEGTGNTLRLHPAVTVAGEFAEPVNAWRGIPQTYECTQLLGFGAEAQDRLWIVPAFAHPMGFATMLPGHGTAHRELMRQYGHVAVLTAMLHDETAGEVEPDGDLGVAINYWPNRADAAQLMRGMEACGELLFAAGATRVHLPFATPAVYERPEALAGVRDLELKRGLCDVTAVHPMGSVPMGDDPQQAAVDSRGRHHHVSGLWVADGSLFPTSIGVPPQLSIYAMGLHVGRDLAAAG